MSTMLPLVPGINTGGSLASSTSETPLMPEEPLIWVRSMLRAPAYQTAQRIWFTRSSFRPSPKVYAELLNGGFEPFLRIAPQSNDGAPGSQLNAPIDEPRAFGKI